MQLKDRVKKIIDTVWALTDEVEYEVILNREETPFQYEMPSFRDEKLNQAYLSDNRSITHVEYIRKIKEKVIVEPNYSYCISGFNKIISFTAFYPWLLPSYVQYITSFFRKKKKVHTAILFDGDIGANYFHFFSDVINKIWMLPNIENGLELPLIIGEKTYNTKYFQHFLKRTDLKKYNWLVQKKGEYIEVENIYILHPFPYEKKYFEKTRSVLNVPAKENVNKRIFIDRSDKVGRRISNFNEIAPILAKYGFEIFDTADKELEFQMNLFGSAKFVIGLHGAANTNILFSDKSLRFLEISPGNRICSHYYWLSKVIKIAYYDAILGGDILQVNVFPESGFYLDPIKFETAVIKMLDHH